MSDCGVCISADDYDAPAFYHETVVKARKPYVCCECSRTIAVGQQYQRTTGKWDDEVGTYKTCLDCVNIRDAFRCDGGFLFCQLWDSLYQEQKWLNTGCLEKIKTASAKAYFMDRLRKCRGITV